MFVLHPPWAGHRCACVNARKRFSASNFGVCVQLYAMTDWRHGFHFFGRNDIEAWSSDGSRLLRCRSQQLPHDMDAADTLAIGYIPFLEGGQCCVEPSLVLLMSDLPSVTPHKA